MKALFAIFLAALFLTGCQTTSQKTGIENGEILVTWKGTTLMHVTDLPKFSDYPSSEKFSGTRAEDIDFTSHKRARSFRTRLREGLKEEPDLAGKYKIVPYGCGTSCRNNLILNLETGDVCDEFPSSYGVLSYPDSHLIIMNIPDDNPEYMLSATFSITRYYLFQNEKLTLLKEINYWDYYTQEDFCDLTPEDLNCDW